MRDSGMMYLLAIGPNAEILDENFRNPYASALEVSVDGKLGYMRLPAEVSRLQIPSGTAVRVPAMLGCRLAQNKCWRVLQASDFYSRGFTQPDPYVLQDEVNDLKDELKKLRKAALKAKSATGSKED